MNLDDWAEKAYEQLINDGFESLDIAQSLGTGMMTGLAGAGYYLLSKTSRKIDQDFMTLS
jgi:lantibiotic modifying enzyme